MKILITEDDFTSRLLLQSCLQPYGECHIAVNGREAVDAIRAALEANEPYNLVCMDIMMPEMDGQEALHQIRELEEARGILSTDGAKIIMTTAKDDLKSVRDAYTLSSISDGVITTKDLCDAYLTKPIDRKRLLDELKTMGLILK